MRQPKDHMQLWRIFHPALPDPPQFASTQRAIHTVIGINAAVFFAWRVAATNARLQRSLMNNATVSWSNHYADRYWTLVIAAFSHQNAPHIFSNMLFLASFGAILSRAGYLGIDAIHVEALTRQRPLWERCFSLAETDAPQSLTPAWAWL